MKAVLLCASFLVLLFANKVNAQAPALAFDTVIRNLTQPMQIVHAGDSSGRLFIVQKTGAIRVFSKTFQQIGTFLTVSPVSTTSERGVLSMVFHPDYKNNGFFFVNYTNPSGNIVLARYKVSSNPDVADAASRVIVDTIPHPVNANHNGGELHFGKDGYLYMSTGDGGGTGDTANNAQNLNRKLGKILRYDVNTSNVAPYYTVPADNPFGNEIFAYGLRNPFRWSFNRTNGDMWIGDVGQEKFEEINFRPADSVKGVNYGWRCYEGTQTYNITQCSGPASQYNFPIYTYPTNAANNVAITGGLIYNGDVYLDLMNYYVAAEYYSGNFFKIRSAGANTWDTSTQKIAITNITDFGEDEDGEIYVVSFGTGASNTGRVYKMRSSGAIRYRFTGNGDWATAGNWKNDQIPPAILPARSEIVIDPVEGGECVLNGTQTILPGGIIEVKDNKQFRIVGNLDILPSGSGRPMKK
ncbi:MAG: PQQ-dependent sugar dehydrogenase [Ferruginibacter sp.]